MTDLSTGIAVANGIEVTALVGNTVCATTAVGDLTPSGRFTLTISADWGAEIWFMVGDQVANERIEWSNAGLNIVNLTVGNTPAFSAGSLTDDQRDAITSLRNQFGDAWQAANDESHPIWDTWDWYEPQSTLERKALRLVSLAQDQLDTLTAFAQHHLAASIARDAIWPWMESLANYWGGVVESTNLFLAYVRDASDMRWDSYQDARSRNNAHYAEYQREDCALVQRLGYVNATEICAGGE